MAQYLYSVASEYQTAGSLTVNNITAPFFAYYAPQASLKSKTYSSNTKEFASVIASLKAGVMLIFVASSITHQLVETWLKSSTATTAMHKEHTI
jgi:hypothetical protein